MDALVRSMLRHVSGNFKAKSGSQNRINKVATEFKALKAKAPGRQQEVGSCFQNHFENPLWPQQSFSLWVSSLFLFFLFLFVLPSQTVNNSTHRHCPAQNFADIWYEGNKKRKRKKLQGSESESQLILNFIEKERKTHPELLKLGVNISRQREM